MNNRSILTSIINVLAVLFGVTLSVTLGRYGYDGGAWAIAFITTVFANVIGQMRGFAVAMDKATRAVDAMILRVKADIEEEEKRNARSS